MPASFALPPVEYCFGTKPIHAAKSRPLRNAAPLPIAATIAVATMGPMPGICRMRQTPRVTSSNLFELVGQFIDLLFDGLPLIPQEADYVAHHRCQCVLSVLENICHRCLELGWL